MSKFPPPPTLRAAAATATTSLLKRPPQRHRQPPQPPPQPPPQHKKPPQNSLTKRPLPTPITFPSPALSDAQTLFRSLSSKNPIDRKFCNFFLQSYSSISTLQDSVSLLNFITKNCPSFSPDRSTYHVVLLQACKLQDECITAIGRVLDVMGNNGFEPDRATLDIGVRALCLARREENAVELMKLFCEKEVRPDTYTYNFLVKCLVRTRSLSFLNGFIKEMREGFGAKPDLVTYTIMIDNVCNGGNLREATRLLDVLSEEGFKPDCYVYNTIMKGYCLLSQGGEVLKVYKKMLEGDVKPDLITYNTLIFGLSKAGRVNEATKYLKVMEEAGHAPDAVTYTSLMNGLCREGSALKAFELLEEMEDRGCSPNSCTYNTLLHGLCKGKYLDKGVELYEEMKKSEMKLEPGAYGTFLRALCRNGRVADAYEVFDYAVESKSLTDVSAYTTLEGTLKWLKKAKEQGLAV